MSSLFQSLTTLDPHWIYAVIFLVAFIENIFPPSPSDAIVVFGGALAGMEKGNFLAALASAAIGSTVGFMTMFLIGKWFGRKILETGKIKFIRPDVLHRSEAWFARYGYWLIVANRFLAGTRAVVPFFAGISVLDFTRTSVLSLVSSTLWYGILIYAGYSLGEHWEKVGFFLKTYSEAMTVLVVVVAVIIFVRYKQGRRSAKGGGV